MMREIKFRARQAYGTKAGNWLFGSLILTSDIEAIAEGFGAQISGDHLPLRYVAIETVGQLTGLQDKDGKDIYEGDILCTTMRHSEITGAMTWDNERGAWSNFRPLHRFIVIGNIYENPELLNETHST